MRKELSSDIPEYSNKTFDFFSGSPTLSMGLTQYVGIPQYRVDLSLEFFKYEFIYNDYWLDFSRIGGIFRARAEFIDDLFVQAYLGMYTDSFLVPVLKQDTCRFVARGPRTESESKDPKQCLRTDNGTMFNIGLYYSYSQFTRFDFSFTSVQNAVPTQEAYDRSTSRILFSATMAFPSTDRAFKYLNRYTETAFRKEID
jgi:hypothetical protein